MSSRPMSKLFGLSSRPMSKHLRSPFVIPTEVEGSPINSAIYKALCACFGLLPSSAEASALIRQAYQDPEITPHPPRTADVIYFLQPDPSAPEPLPSYAAENPSTASHTPTVFSFSAWTLQVICYGPHAEENARRIRALIFIDGAGMPRSILRKAGIRPVPSPPEPLLLHEPEGSLWRQRADLTIALRAEEKQTHPVRRGAVTVPPAVVIRHERG